MEMNLPNVARVANNMLEWIKTHNSVESISSKIDKPDGSTVDDKHSGEEYIIVAKHPRAPGALVVNYFRRNGQTPMTIILNIPSNYTKIMLTASEQLAGFEAFDEVPNWGKLQDKRIEGIDFSTIEQELTALTKLA